MAVMWFRRRWCLGMVLLAGPAAATAAEPSKLDASRPVDWRGAPLRVVLDELSREMDLPYLLDPSVNTEHLDTRLRLFAAHLTGRQAFRWAARLAGLEAAIRDGAVLVSGRDRLPRVWRLTGGGVWVDEDQRLAAVQSRRADLEWIDLPLSAVSRAVATDFGIDVIFHPQLVADEGLVQLVQVQADLDMVRAVLEQQLKAKTTLFDGAVWVTPPEEAPKLPTTQSASVADSSGGAGAIVDEGRALDRWVMLDPSIQSWPALCDRFAQAAEIPCRVAPPSAAWATPFEARGSVGEVLEAGRLLKRWTWRPISDARGAISAIELRPVSPQQ